MADKKSWETFRVLAQAPYWNPEYAELFADNCILRVPNAPPGMPQYFEPEELPVHFDWLSRTTKNWHFYDIKEYGAPEDTDIFWLMRRGECLASWGGQKDYHFRSLFILKAEIKDGKVLSIKELFDPLEFLRAAGREIPVFPFLLDPAAVEADRPRVEAKKKAVLVCDDPPEVCEARKQNVLKTLTLARNAPDGAENLEAVEAPNCDGALYFAPPDMHEDCSPHRCPGIGEWEARAEEGRSYHFDGSSPFYATADPDVFFAEAKYHSDVQWPGCPEGGYRNSYFELWRFDRGYVVEYSEAFNPISKFNSANISIPSFPYFFDL